MSRKAVVLLSAGLDSTVNCIFAQREHQVDLALTFDYGQRAAAREIDRAREICRRFDIKHQVANLPWLGEMTKTSLVNRSVDVPTQAQVSLDDCAVSLRSADAVWVPNRNGVFLNIAAAFAESLEADWVIPGFNAEEAATFPDNSREFLQATDYSLRFSTRGQVVTQCFTAGMNKTEIVLLGREIGAPFDLMWPCYLAGERPCGECESCLRFYRAASAAGLNIEAANR